jgi:AcrR family transcriptional regulator
MAATADRVTDGRTARRERGRAAVADAVFELVHEGHHPLAAERIAERAGVSVSSLFRYFDGLDDLQQHTIDRYLARFAPLFEVPMVGQGRRDERIERYVAARTGLYQAIHPVARLARARALDHPAIARTLRDVRRRQADDVRRHFAPELRGRSRHEAADLVGSISTLTSFESWDHLQGDLGRSEAQVRRAWVRALGALCDPGGRQTASPPCAPAGPP